MCWKIAELLVFVSVLVQVHSFDKCDSKISEYILKNNNHPNQTTKTLAMHSWSYIRLPEVDIAKGAKCVRQYFDQEYDTCKSARIITYLQQSQLVEDCEFDDKGNGYLIERKSNNRTNYAYIFIISENVVGYYRCGNSDTNGVHQGACMISCGTQQSDTKVSADIKKCETMLTNAGIGKLAVVNECKSLIS